LSHGTESSAVHDSLKGAILEIESDGVFATAESDKLKARAEKRTFFFIGDLLKDDFEIL
jgi:hypothetical protein